MNSSWPPRRRATWSLKKQVKARKANEEASGGPVA
jgi:hypothetical protein